jgi:hypothetical protein
MDLTNDKLLITLLILLTIASVCLVCTLWAEMNATNNAEKWRQISEEIKKCKHGDVYCQGYIMYKYGEGEEFEKISKYCYEKYKNKCQLSKMCT